MPPSTPMIFTAQDKHGLRWAFDPAAQRWTVTGAGLKSSSQKLETLQAKAQAWLKAKSGDAPASRDTIELDLVQLEYQDHRYGPLGAVMVRIKAAWNDAEGRYTVVRHLPDDPSSNWRTFGGDGLTLLDPLNPDAEALAWCDERLTDAAKETALRQAEADVYRHWMALKEPQDRTFAIAPEGVEDLDPPTPRMGMHHTVRTASTQAPLFFLKEPEDLLALGWQEHAPGHWSLSEDGPWVRLRTPDIQGAIDGRYEVGHGRGDGQAVLLEGASMKVAMLLALAMTRETILELDEHQAWVGQPQASERRIQWPLPVALKAQVALRLANGKDMVFQLARQAPQAPLRSTSYRGFKIQPEWTWVEIEVGSYTPPPRYWPAGPEDRALEALAPLLAEAEGALGSFSRYHAGASLMERRGGGAELLGAWVSEAQDRSDEPRTPMQVRQAWDALKARLARTASQKDDVVAWAGRCKAAVDQALATATPRKAPRP